MKKLRYIWIAICTILLLSACTASELGGTAEEPSQGPTWQEQYDLGVRYLSEGNYQEAILTFSAAIEIDPKRAPAYVGRGDAYAKSGETEEHLSAAKADYEKAIELDESSAEAYLGLADVYIRQGDVEKAMEILQRGLEKASNTQKILDAITGLEAKNTYGQTEFTRRRQYCAFENMSANQKELIELVLSIALEQDGTKLFNLYQDCSWDNPSMFNREQYGVCTILNGYKLAFQYSPDCITIEVRPENGIGYYATVYPPPTNKGIDYMIILTSCSCADWQWNGVYNEKAFSMLAGVDLVFYGEESGAIKEGLREGVFEGVYSRYNEGIYSEYTYRVSNLYQDGILIENNGHTIENPSTICGIALYGGTKNQWLDALYW